MAGIQAGSLVAFACVCWGFDNHRTALIDGLTPAESTFWKGLVAWSANLLLGAVAYGLSIVCYIQAAQRVGATRAQLVFATSPFFGVVLSLLLLGERLTFVQEVAALILTGALLLLFWDRHAHAHEHVETTHQHWHRHDDGYHGHLHPDLPAAVGHPHAH